MKLSEDKELCTQLLALGYLGKSDWHSIEEWLWEKHKTCVSTARYKSKPVSYGFIVFRVSGYSEKPICEDDGHLKVFSPITAKIEGIKAAVKYLYETPKSAA